MTHQEMANGHRESAHWITPHVPVQRTPPLAEALMPGTTTPTRKLCTLVYVEDGLREIVTEHFQAWRSRAWAPCYSVDLIALLRHTKRARGLTTARDFLLSATIIAAILSIGVTGFDDRLTGIFAVLLAVSAVAAVRLAMVKQEVSIRALTAKLFRYLRKKQHRSALLLLGLVLAAALILQSHDIRLILLTIAITLLTSWIIIVTFAAIAYVYASRVLTARTDLRTLARPQSKAMEARASDISNANVLVYSRDRAGQPLGPFVGAGHRLIRWTTPPVDVTKRKDPEKTPASLELPRLHKALEAAASEHGLSTLHCQHRLYADGRAMTGMTDLFSQERDAFPRTTIAETAILSRVAEPQRYQRGYLCLRAAEPDGDVVVTLFVRAMLEQELLQIEISVHALPEITWPKPRDLASAPVSPSAKQSPPAAKVPPRGTHAAWSGIRMGTKFYWPVLFGGIYRFALVAVSPLTHLIIRQLDRQKIVRHQYDFGAETSLRERLAMQQEIHYNSLIDMMAHAGRLQHRLVKAVSNYLESLGIDPADFAERSVTIIMNNQQNLINTLHAGAVTFGDNSPVNAGQPAPPANPQQPTAPQERQ